MIRKKITFKDLGLFQFKCTRCQKAFVAKKDEIFKNGWFEINTSAGTMLCSTDCLHEKRPKHKFNAVKCESDGIKFSSKAERSYYKKLKVLQASGEVLFFLRQTPLHLSGNTKYVVDFQVFYSDGTVAFIDVKGMSTPMFILKKKQVEDLYPIQIEIVK